MSVWTVTWVSSLKCEYLAVLLHVLVLYSAWHEYNGLAQCKTVDIVPCALYAMLYKSVFSCTIAHNAYYVHVNASFAPHYLSIYDKFSMLGKQETKLHKQRVCNICCALPNRPCKYLCMCVLCATVSIVFLL